MNMLLTAPPRRVAPCVSLFCALALFILPLLSNAAEPSKDDAERAKAALDLRIYQATADALVTQREAESRKAIAEAERAELLARLPPSTSRPLAGKIDADQFGAAGLVKAFDLAQDLAQLVCSQLPEGKSVVLYESASTQGVVAARMVHDSLERLADDLTRQNQVLQSVIDAYIPSDTKARAFSPLFLAVVPATVKAGADIAALFKSDVSVTGTDYGNGARALFATALAQSCPRNIAGLGAGYLGELDMRQHAQLLAKVRALAALRGAFAQKLGTLGSLVDAAKGQQKKALSNVETTAGALLKTVDTYVESLKAGEASDKSPLFNTARFLGYAERTSQALVLDFDLRLEGMTLIKDHWFTGQRLHLSGVAFLWYRLYEPDGTLRLAKTIRKITVPVNVDLRGQDVKGDFWDHPVPAMGRQN